ncbi:uncharacterized protein LOC113141491 isoform X2 [Mastacembelus armatus]|uniref:uncharacterized protein LOC113141491 isoform X2 n=1 Tax=Mastacembelus armatus TaxID=205130 RepID=UPI000E45A84F|nr:uncharacterized protein LOC113141491 isoform X2 [Mastacembelus armatus]
MIGLNSPGQTARFILCFFFHSGIVDGHAGNMKSWRYVTSLFIFVFVIKLSKEHCEEYFNMEDWHPTNLIQNFTVVTANTSIDIIKCTLCHKLKKKENIQLSSILYNCFNHKCSDVLVCGKETSHTIWFYHMMCLMAQATKDIDIAPGCQYGQYEYIYNFHPKETNDKGPPSKYKSSNQNMRNCLIFSVILNIVLPLGVYLYMRKRHTTKCESSQAVEAMLLLQLQCQSVVTHSADAANNGCTVAHGLAT